jgi:hypothetical protein
MEKENGKLLVPDIDPERRNTIEMILTGKYLVIRFTK